MRFRPRHLSIRFLLPLVCRFSERQKTRILQEFAKTELDSAWQSVYALERLRNPETRLLLLDHALEELFHADLFARLAAEKSPDLPPSLITRREPLIPLSAGKNGTGEEGRAAEYLACLATGETEINGDFEVYEKALSDPDIRRVIRTIRQDEVWHAKDSTERLERLAAESKVSLPWIRLRHQLFLGQRRYASVMGKFGAIPMTLLLFVAYAVFGPIFYRQARRRLEAERKAQLAFLQKQLEDFRGRFVS